MPNIDNPHHGQAAASGGQLNYNSEQKNTLSKRRVAIAIVGAAAAAATHSRMSGPTDTRNLPPCTPLHMRNVAQHGNAGTLHSYAQHTAISSSFVGDNGVKHKIVDDIASSFLSSADNSEARHEHPKAYDTTIPGDARSLYDSIEYEQKHNSNYWIGNTCADRAARIIDRHYGCQVDGGARHNLADMYPVIGKVMPGKSPVKVAELVNRELQEAGLKTDGHAVPVRDPGAELHDQLEESGFAATSSVSSSAARKGYKEWG